MFNLGVYIEKSVFVILNYHFYIFGTLRNFTINSIYKIRTDNIVCLIA